MKTAIIGAGVICEQHTAALRHVPGVRIVGICDRSRAMAEYAAERFGAAEAYTDHRVMLDAARPDVVHVLTPAATHPQLVRDCLNADSHVIVEKPAALTHDDLVELLNLSQRRKRYLVEDHNYRFNMPIRRMDTLVAQGKLGTIEEVEMRIALDVRGPGSRYADANCPHPSHRLPAGVIHEFITHMAYLALHFVAPSNDEPLKFDQVNAAWNNHAGDELFKFDDLDATIIMERHGTHPHIHLRFSARLQPASFYVAVRGTTGFAETDLFHPYVRAMVSRAGGRQLTWATNHLATSYIFLHAAWTEFARKLQGQSAYDGLCHLIAATYHAIEHAEQPPVTRNDMEEASRLVDVLIAAGHQEVKVRGQGKNVPPLRSVHAASRSLRRDGALNVCGA